MVSLPGESEFTSYGCRALLEEQAISILQFDATMYGGFTEGRKLAALCELNHVQVARIRVKPPGKEGEMALDFGLLLWDPYMDFFGFLR